jgi:hypothetical protein
MMELRARARYAPINGVIPLFPGIYWSERRWLIMPVATFIAAMRYAANIAEHQADQATLTLVQNGHAMEPHRWQELRNHVHNSRATVTTLEDDISSIFSMMIAKSANEQAIFEVTFPRFSITQAYLVTIRDGDNFLEDFLELNNFDYEFLDDVEACPPVRRRLPSVLRNHRLRRTTRRHPTVRGMSLEIAREANGWYRMPIHTLVTLKRQQLNRLETLTDNNLRQILLAGPNIGHALRNHLDRQIAEAWDIIEENEREISILFNEMLDWTMHSGTNFEITYDSDNLEDLCMICTVDNVEVERVEVKVKGL